jgi:CDGSH-type Zn-finger protein
VTGHGTGYGDAVDAAAEITPYRDGPLIVRGDFVLLDEDGREIDPGRKTVALCRCGRSKLRPFCDGTHRRAGFRAEGGLSPAAAERRPGPPPRA